MGSPCRWQGPKALNYLLPVEDAVSVGSGLMHCVTTLVPGQILIYGKVFTYILCIANSKS